MSKFAIKNHNYIQFFPLKFFGRNCPMMRRIYCNIMPRAFANSINGFLMYITSRAIWKINILWLRFKDRGPLTGQ